MDITWIVGLVTIVSVLVGAASWMWLRYEIPLIELRKRVIELEKAKAIADANTIYFKDYLDKLADRDKKDHEALRHDIGRLEHSIEVIQSDVKDLLKGLRKS